LQKLLQTCSVVSMMFYSCSQSHRVVCSVDLCSNCQVRFQC